MYRHVLGSVDGSFSRIDPNEQRFFVGKHSARKVSDRGDVRAGSDLDYQRRLARRKPPTQPLVLRACSLCIPIGVAEHQDVGAQDPTTSRTTWQFAQPLTALLILRRSKVRRTPNLTAAWSGALEPMY